MVVSGEGSGEVGTSYSLTCRVTLPLGVAEVSPNIQWKRHNMPYTPASTPDSTSSRRFHTTLELNPLQSTDAGEYICQASYSLGGYTSPLVTDSLTLEVISKSLFNALYFLIEQPTTGQPVTVPPVPEVAVSVRSEGSAVAGSTDYSLVCETTTIPSLSDTPPSVTWRLPSAAATVTGATVASRANNYVSRLPLTPLTYDHEGEYTCTAQYTVNGATYSASISFTLDVGECVTPYSLESLNMLFRCS